MIEEVHIKFFRLFIYLFRFRVVSLGKKNKTVTMRRGTVRRDNQL